MADITIKAENVSVEHSGYNKKVEITIAGLEISEVIDEIGLGEIISACNPDDVLPYITFDGIKSYFESEGYTISEEE